ncbi:MAG: hypothetical protein MZV70_22055 [Desulfobacterales bacterium]|nr:hypothetical protein [Desulfobacterales bacterium]
MNVCEKKVFVSSTFFPNSLGDGRRPEVPRDPRAREGHRTPIWETGTRFLERPARRSSTD